MPAAIPTGRSSGPPPNSCGATAGKLAEAADILDGPT